MNMSKYKFYHYTNKLGQNTVVAISSYCGRTVKGYAKCNPEDTFDLEKGKKLAAARCNFIIAQKRNKRAKQKYAEAATELNKLHRFADKMQNYYSDSTLALDEARRLLMKTESEM